VLLVLPAIVVWQLFTVRRSAVRPVALCVGAVTALWLANAYLLPLQWIYLGCAVILAPLLFSMMYPWTWPRLLMGILAMAVFVAALIGSWRFEQADTAIYVLGSGVVIAWMIFARHSGSLIRFAIGIMLAVGCIASPWMVSNDMAWSWIIAVLIALQLLVSLCFNRRWSRNALVLHLAAAAVCMELVLWPWVQPATPDYFWYAVAATFALIAAARFLPRRFAPAWFCAGAAGAIFACVPLFGTSMDWYTVGIKASTDQHRFLGWCFPTNLSGILETPNEWNLSNIYGRHYDWDWGDEINLADYLHFLHQPWHVPLRYLMITAYLLCATLSGIGMAVQHRRRSPYFFFAMVAPWVLMFTLLPQMQARYLLWAAVFSAAAASFSIEGLLLCILLSAINVIDTSLFMFKMGYGTSFFETYGPWFIPFFPGISWAVLLIAGIWLYLALKPGRRLSSKPGRVAPVPPVPQPLDSGSTSPGPVFELQSPGAIA